MSIFAQNYNTEHSRAITRRTDAPKVGLVIGLCHLKTAQNRCKSADVSQIAAARYPLQLRWRPLAAAEAGAAASGAAGMPVRRPRRPTAVSAAFEADAGPELGCAGQLERAAEAPNGEVSSLWVGLSVSRSGGRSGLVRRSISRLGLCLVGSSVRAGALCFRGLGIRIFLSPPLFVCGGWSAAVCLCAFWRNSSVEEPPCSSLPFSRSFSSALAQ